MSDSIWRSIDTAEKSDYGKMECMEMTDVAIVGGGLCGILCAWFLKDAGVDCILLDKNRIAGGTGKDAMAQVTSQHGLIYSKLVERDGAEKARMYFQANELAIQKYRELSEQINCDFEETSSYVYSKNDREKLVEIGLSYLPENCMTAQAIRKAVDCYHSGVDFIEARKMIHNAAPGTFGIQGIAISEIPTDNNEGMELGAAGFDAPENVAFVVLGLLYGEGDFGKSLILANNCGEDTDCTCATLGALLGIMNGASNLPKKWTDPLNDKIVTMCINKTGGGIWVPERATQLAERILRDIPGFLGQDLCDVFAEGGMKIECCEKEALFCKKIDDYLPYINLSGRMYETPLNELCAQPYVARYQFTAFQVWIDYEGSAFFKKGENRKFKVKVINSNTMREQQWVKIKLYLPDGVTAVGASEVEMPLNNLYLSCAEKEFELNTESFMSGRLELIVDVSLNGRHSSGPVKIVLLGQ